jgi:hypothetical protein
LRFFTKTLGRMQTDCQHGGRSMHGVTARVWFSSMLVTLHHNFAR